MPYVCTHVYPDWSWYTMICCVANPFPFLLIRWLTFPQFLLCLMTSTCAILGPAFGLFFLYHMRQILRNLTSVEVAIANKQNPSQITYEDELRPLDFNRGRLANVEQVLGKKWLICFLLPFIPAQQTSNGLHFPYTKPVLCGDGPTTSTCVI